MIYSSHLFPQLILHGSLVFTLKLDHTFPLLKDSQPSSTLLNYALNFLTHLTFKFSSCKTLTWTILTYQSILIQFSSRLMHPIAISINCNHPHCFSYPSFRVNTHRRPKIRKNYTFDFVRLGFPKLQYQYRFLNQYTAQVLMVRITMNRL